MPTRAGPPGGCTTTLAVQFLLTGREGGEGCLFVSTKQTVDELRDTSGPEPFDVGAPGLAVATGNADPGFTIEADRDPVEVRLTAATTKTGSDDVVVYATDPNIQSGELLTFPVAVSAQSLAFRRDDDGRVARVRGATDR